jgi:hypothetical protein
MTTHIHRAELLWPRFEIQKAQNNQQESGVRFTPWMQKSTE